MAGEEFRVGPFSTGDLIALGGVVFMTGTLWWRVTALERADDRSMVDRDRLATRMSSIEQALPNAYVRREEYREDLREIKVLLQRVELKIEDNERRGGP